MGIPSITSNLSGFRLLTPGARVRSQSYGIYIFGLTEFISVEESDQEAGADTFRHHPDVEASAYPQRNRTERLRHHRLRRLHKYYTESRVSGLCKPTQKFEPECVKVGGVKPLQVFEAWSSITRTVRRGQKPEYSIDLDDVQEGEADDEEEEAVSLAKMESTSRG